VSCALEKPPGQPYKQEVTGSIPVPPMRKAPGNGGFLVSPSPRRGLSLARNGRKCQVRVRNARRDARARIPTNEFVEAVNNSMAGEPWPQRWGVDAP
jgi:hypothetical protein